MLAYLPSWPSNTISAEVATGQNPTITRSEIRALYFDDLYEMRCKMVALREADAILDYNDKFYELNAGGILFLLSGKPRVIFTAEQRQTEKREELACRRSMASASG